MQLGEEVRASKSWQNPQSGRSGNQLTSLLQALYLSVSASTPGSFLPSRNSRLAPPPVEMWVIWSATPAWLMADTASPPPMMEMAALLAATALARALVPTANLGNSKTPAGPFHTMVRAVETTSSMAATDLGPMSRPCQSAGKFTEVSQGWVLASGANASARTLSTGSRRLTPLALALSIAALAMSIL